MPKVSIELTEEEMKAIKYLKTLKKTTGREVLRRALSVYGMLEDARSNNKKTRIIVEEPGSDIKKELILPD